MRFGAAALVLAALAAALALRLPALRERPMHCDEAVHAVKFGGLWETGQYEYDPIEFHGPTIYYLALPVAWLRGATTFEQTTEFTYRIVPALLGAVLVLMTLLVFDGLGRWEAAVAAVLTAVSPAMVFYSRYYIQEIPLVVFTFGLIAFGWRYIQSRRIAYALLAGACAGLMHATKETCIIAFGCIAAALAVEWYAGRGRGADAPEIRRCRSWPAIVAGVAVAAVVSFLCFSTLLRNVQGPLDSIRTFTTYFDRAGGGGIHDHPPLYYLKLLAYTKLAPGPWWSEGLILGLALVGAGVSLRPELEPRTRLRRFVAIYTILMTLIYSAIPYKTPWCLLGFLHGMILLAGVGAVAVIRAARWTPLRVLAVGALLFGVVQLERQAQAAAFRFHSDNRNPYVYAHPLSGVLKLRDWVEKLAAVDPAGHDVLIQVVTPDYWPIPWYLRSFTHVGYWESPPETIAAPIVITSPALHAEVERRLPEGYHANLYSLRPDARLVVLVSDELWQRFRRHEGTAP